MKTYLFLSHRYPKNKGDSCLEKDFVKALDQAGKKIFIITPLERRFKQKTHIYKDGNIEILYVKTGNRTKQYNIFEKIFTILSTPYLLKKAQKKYWSNLKIDNVVGYTPFMSNYGFMNYLKKFYNSKTILFLWDIMPQTAKDMGMIKSNLIFKYMKKNELKLYQMMDKIIYNCNEAKNYLLENGCRDNEKLVLIRNSEFIKEDKISEKSREKIRTKYGYTSENMVFIFGGNMGMLQNLDNLLNLAKEVLKINKIKFIFIGDGKDYRKIEERIKEENIKNVQLISVIPKEEYDETISAFDGGLIVLSEKNTVPNFPTKVTAYLKMGMPMFGILDKSAGRGLGKYILDKEIGLWSNAGDLNATKEEFIKFVENIDRNKYMKETLIKVYKKDYDVKKAVIKFMEMN